MCEYQRIFGLILVTVVSVIVLAVPADAEGESLAINALAAISDKIPNKILGWNLNDMRPWRRAIMAIMIPKMVYHRLKKKYKKEIRKNKRNQRKYRTIVPVSILPPIISSALFNRDIRSKYYIVGADDSKEPLKLDMPNEMNEIPDDPKLNEALKYQHD